MVLVAGVKQTTQHNILYLLGNYEHIRTIYFKHIVQCLCLFARKYCKVINDSI